MSEKDFHSAVGSSGGSRRILIIDDEADIREVASAALEFVAGWHVSQAISGAQGIAIARRELPDAILLDAQMPGMDGPATLKVLRDSGELTGIPVLFLTARVQGADYRLLNELGAKAVLRKPFDPLTLADEIASVLGWS